MSEGDRSPFELKEPEWVPDKLVGSAMGKGPGIKGTGGHSFWPWKGRGNSSFVNMNILLCLNHIFYIVFCFFVYSYYAHVLSYANYKRESIGVERS